MAKDLKCEVCNGTRMAVPDCEKCEGNGWVYDPTGGTMCCPECGGDECEACDGTGEKP